MRIHVHATAATASHAAALAAAVATGWQETTVDDVTVTSSVVPPSVREMGRARLLQIVPTPLAMVEPVPIAPDTDMVLAVVANVDHRVGGPADPTPLTTLARTAVELAVPFLVIAGRSEVVRREYAAVPITFVREITEMETGGQNDVIPDVLPEMAARVAARLARTWSTGERRCLAPVVPGDVDSAGAITKAGEND